MVEAVLLAVIAALVVGFLGWLFKARIFGSVRHAWWWLFKRRRQETQRALRRIVDELIRLRGEDSSVDDEIYEQLIHWFMGSLEAGPDYQAMNDRVRERQLQGKY